MTRTDASKIYAAYADLEAATEAYYTALKAFKAVYEPKTMGIDELSEHINMCITDLDQELDTVL